MLTSRTSVYGLIGDPLEHSISPQIQNAAYAKMGLDAVYLCFRVRGSVVKAVRAAPILGISGLNVTIPYKSRVIRALDAVDELARKIGAVNVIRFGEETAGYNTDVAASMRVLREVAGDDLSGRSALLLGAGGSARAMAFGLAQEGCAVVVLNRTARKSARLVLTRPRRKHILRRFEPAATGAGHPAFGRPHKRHARRHVPQRRQIHRGLCDAEARDRGHGSRLQSARDKTVARGA